MEWSQLILLLIVLIIFLPFIGFFLYNFSKHMGVIFISSPLVLIVLVVGWWVLATNHYFVSSTNLEYESIGEFRLQETITKERINGFGSFEKREKVDGYSYVYEDFFLSIDKEYKIVSLSVGGAPIETSSGLKVGDTIKKAKQIYGNSYYSYREMGLGIAMVYVDRDNKQKLTLWSQDDNTVANIWLSVY
ncbi:hypothetical protein [Bacillus sp. FJAT-45350]|uniref:hypothetical protein n=1 Tax=Bacillus sp. FJAT-45350 TaxID=2011014 RepID=UPI000BB953FB|nr:hypothetical protein [Bacillus sp. FJAT-45350]